jgi:hypothetical protein
MTMQRARRLASVVVVASLGMAGLSACRSEPSVAAYVGDSERITQDRVDAVYNEVRDKLQASPPASQTPDGQAPDGQPAAPAPTSAVPITRADVVSLLIGSEVIDKLAAGQSLPAPTADQLQEPGLAGVLHLPADSEYAQLYAKWLYDIQALQEKVTTPVDPTDADLHELHDALVGMQGYDPAAPFSKFKSDIAASTNMAVLKQAAGLRNEIAKTAAQLDVRVNPRYQPTKLPVLVTQNQQTGAIVSLITMPIGPDDQVAPVTDAR